MGFSASAVMVIFTAALIYIVTIFYPVIGMSYRNTLEAERMSNELWNEKLNTKIVITEWSGNTLTVFNNGSAVLNSSKVNVMLNGELRTSSSYLISPEGVWPPRTSVSIDIGAAGGRVKIVTANGASDYKVT